MNFARALRPRPFVIAVIASVVVASLIILLVAQVATFSQKVTDFYAPTIHTVRSFAEATHNLKASIEDKGAPDRTTVHSFKEASKNLEHMSQGWDQDYKEHIDNLLIKSGIITAQIEGKNVQREDLLSHVQELDRDSARHVAKHEAELESARVGIRSTAFRIRVVALFLLLTGIAMSFREIQLGKLKEREKEKLSAMNAFVSALDARDPYTKGHSMRVAKYTVMVAREMGFDRESLEHMNIAALMHDIGKMSVPDAVLKKPGKLDDSEWVQMKEHPLSSASILQDFDSLKGIVPWVLHHHERFDGKGYPLGLKGEEIMRYPCRPRSFLWLMPLMR